MPQHPPIIFIPSANAEADDVGASGFGHGLGYAEGFVGFGQGDAIKEIRAGQAFDLPRMEVERLCSGERLFRIFGCVFMACSMFMVLTVKMPVMRKKGEP